MRLKLAVIYSKYCLYIRCASNERKLYAPKRGSLGTSMPGATRLLGFSRDIDCAIELAEFSDGRTNALKAADLNSNGVISLSEFRYWKPRVLGSSSPLTNLVHFDRNFDDEVTQREFDDALDKLFYQADRDKGDSVAYGGFV